jgi:hypothetical protein
VKPNQMTMLVLGLGLVGVVGFLVYNSMQSKKEFVPTTTKYPDGVEITINNPVPTIGDPSYESDWGSIDQTWERNK